MYGYNLNPSCYLPSAVTQYLPASIACPPPPSYLSTIYSTAIAPITSSYSSARRTIDGLMSLPFLSVLLIPTMTSYSTSLNLLFFYITWSTLVLSNPPLYVEIVATLVVRILFYIMPSLFFLSFDALLPGASEGLKALGSEGLPLKDAQRDRIVRVAKITTWSLFNILLSVACQALIEVLFTRVLVIRSALRVTTSLPMPWGIFRDLLRGFVFREFIAYVLHRYVLHDARLPLLSSAARDHQSWYHALPTPFPMTASYDHPTAYLIRSFVPTFLPAMLFRFHLLTYTVYLALVSLEETFAYSGYSTLPTNVVLGGVARRTDNHLLCGGEGNFSPWGLADWLCGTSVGGDVMEDVVTEAAGANGVAADAVAAVVKRRGTTMSRRKKSPPPPLPRTRMRSQAATNSRGRRDG